MSDDLRAALEAIEAEIPDPTIDYGLASSSQTGYASGLRKAAEIVRAALATSDGLDVEALGRAIVAHLAKTWATEPCVAICATDIAREYAALRSTPEERP